MLPPLLFVASFTAINAKSSLDILVMADWGGSGRSPYTTTCEVDSAKIMGDIGHDFEVDMVWGLGDNFYERGVKDEYDRRFNETFESVFSAPSLSKIPFYMVAGNHDHHGNATGQIMYSNHSKRWTFPDLYYTKVFKVPGTHYHLQLVMIDTVVLEGITHDQEYCDKHHILKCLIHPEGPSDLQAAQTQYEWIESTLKASTADFLVVAGHYPVYSIAEHGSTSGLIEKLKPMMLKYNVTAYFSGHDHTFEYIESEGIDYIDTGGTHVCDGHTNHNGTIPTNSLIFHGCEDGGFTRIKVDEKGMRVYYYFGSDGKVRYTVPVRKARDVTDVS